MTETIFLDEINLLFKGNIVQDVREIRSIAKYEYCRKAKSRDF
ncbi:MAG: hypothetical protein MRERV_28c024 [Mycoplasmataceae bacterium RV_VA103A]|nr:MAG: hypothetical protein MRERV_28c024 [Mycoplasmataceae bacterium RV_VA103A]